MEWVDDSELERLANAVVDAAIALRVACLFARPRGPGSRSAAKTTTAFDDAVDGLIDDIFEAPTADRAGHHLDRLCLLLAETANATEHMAQMPGAQLAWNELLHGRAELGVAYQRAAALRWRAWCRSRRHPERLRTAGK